MKACKVCGRLYEDSDAFCQADGKELSRISQAPVPSNDSDPRVGRRLSERFLIFRVVADGAMGRVYEALDQETQRHVAIKILHDDVARDPVSVERFKREFEISEQLPHAHVVDVLDFRETVDGSFALAMEFLVGEELGAALQRETVLPPERCVRLLSQVALGIDPAHKKQIIHRDLKPGNIFLCQTAQGDIAKVLDFGSVKDKRGSAKQLTVLGTTIGSPFYMAPEQAQGLDTLDHRADVWAMAAIMYECVTGDVPFPGQNAPSILMKILSKDPVAASLAAQGRAYPVPFGVDQAIFKALKKTALVRTPSVGQFADEFGRAYGLEGDHSVWAETSESELGERIQQRLPALLKSKQPSTRPPDALGDFFGENDALGADGAGVAVVAPAAEARTKSRPSATPDKRKPGPSATPDKRQPRPDTSETKDASPEDKATANVEASASATRSPRLGSRSDEEPLHVPTVSWSKSYLAIGLAVTIIMVLIILLAR